MPTNSDLGERLESYLATLVREGRYPSRDEVLREGVRLVEEREKRLAERDVALARGIADADAGRLRPLTEVADRLTARYRAMAAPIGE